MKRRVTPLPLALLLLAAGAMAQAAPSTRPSQAPAGAETKDRISNQDMRGLVQQPLDEVLRGDVAGGERDFEATLKERAREHGSNSVEVADTLTAMGIALMNETTDEDESLRRKAVAYLARAVVATKAAFGPKDPEVALALNDYADAARKVDAADPPAGVQLALEEAYGIRLAKLGPWNSETGATLAYLGEVAGLPSRTGGDKGKVARAAGLISRGIEIAERNLATKPEDPAWMTMALAYLYASNRDLPLAMRNFNQGARLYTGLALGDEAWKVTLTWDASKLATILDEQGFKSDAEAVRRDYPLDAVASVLPRPAPCLTPAVLGSC